MNQSWFEMVDLRTRLNKKAVWTTLRAARFNIDEGEFGHLGYKRDFTGVGTVAIFSNRRDDVGALSWSEVNCNNANDSYFDSGEYVPCDTFHMYRRGQVGIYLVIQQHFNRFHSDEWHLHQDFVTSLCLLREGDTWVCANEGYIEAARLHRNEEGAPHILEVRTEFLRDYLCGRGLSLFQSTYCERTEIVEDSGHIEWKDGLKRESGDDYLWEGSVTSMREGGLSGHIFVSRSGRKDVDPLDDVPSFTYPDEDNVYHESGTYRPTGKELCCIRGELWFTKWLEASEYSPRVRGDNVPRHVRFIVDETGRQEVPEKTAQAVRWLWFEPEMITSFVNRRGGGIRWYTGDTGGVQCSPDCDVHFGVNPIGLINANVRDIALLPEWQQRLWAGFNVAPDGGVSRELLASQAEARPAGTIAPEDALWKSRCGLNETSEAVFGAPLFLEHHAQFETLQQCHRFKALDKAGLFVLAKDLTRLLIDSISEKVLRTYLKLSNEDKRRGLKLLECTLSSLVDSETARNTTSPLVGIYELRKADAHPRSNEISECYDLIGLEQKIPFVYQGKHMIQSCVDCLSAVTEILESKMTKGGCM